MSQDVEQVVAQEVVSEAPVEAQKAAPKSEPEPDYSAKFLELQRREKEVRVKANKLKQELESEKSKWVSELKSNPLAKLSELGITSDQLADHFLAGNTVKADDPMDRVSALESKLAQKEAAEKAAQEAQILADYDKEIFSFVEKDADTFELVLNHRDGKKLYKEAIYSYWRENGEAPDLKAIASEVEAHLEAETDQLMKLKKVSKKLTPTEVKEAAADIAAEVKKDAPKKKTLTSAFTASAAPKVKMVTNGNSYSINSSSTFLDERRAKLESRILELTKGN